MIKVFWTAVADICCGIKGRDFKAWLGRWTALCALRSAMKGHHAVLGAVGAIALLFGAGPAAATVETIDFYQDGALDMSSGLPLPYGMQAGDVVNGSVSVDDAFRVGNSAGTPAITALNFVTGSRIWTLADIAYASAGYNDKGLWSVAIVFDQNNVLLIGGLSKIGEFRIGEGRTTHVQASLVHAPLSGAPEPGSWALMILGFGGVGAMKRWRRQWVPSRRST